MGKKGHGVLRHPRRRGHGPDDRRDRFVCVSHDPGGLWWRSHGNEMWPFHADGRMAGRHASIIDVRIAEPDPLFRWPRGLRPDGHPGLIELGL